MFLDDEVLMNNKEDNLHAENEFLDLINEFDQEINDIDEEILTREEESAFGDWNFISELLETFRLMNSSLDLKRVLLHVMDAAISVINAERGFLVLRNNKGELEFKIARNADKKTLMDSEFQVSQSYLNETIKRKEIIYIEDVLSDQNYSPSQSVRQLKLRSIVCCPMFIHGDLIGVIYADSSKPLIGRSKIKKQLFQLFADQAAEGIRNAQLYQKVKRSYEQLENAQESLIYAEKMAARGKMAARIGHELNNLLSIIYGNLELAIHYLVNDGDDKKVLGHLEFVAKKLDSMTRFSQGLMNNSHMETKIEPCNVNHLVHEFLEFIRPVYKRTGATFEEDFDPEVPEIDVDKGQIQQIFYNITKNAIEVRPDTHITISSRFDKREKQVFITIADTGPGIEKAKLSQIFSPLFTDKAEGHGYGLSICRAIAKKHGGSITVESDLGIGSRFIVSLPVKTKKKKEFEAEKLNISNEFIY